MNDEPNGWPYGDDDVELTKEQIGYTTEVQGGLWTLTVLCISETGQPGGGKTTSAFTPFEEESEEAVVQVATRRWPELKVVSKVEWDKVFFGKWGGQRPTSSIGSTGQRVAAFGRSGRGTRSLPSQGSPGLSAAGLPETWGTRTRSVSGGRSGSNSARSTVSASSVVEKAADGTWPLDEWVPIVQCAKRLGYPPQYLYNAVYHGKIKTQGERPKKALWRDVLSKYRPDILKEITDVNTA
jgi:hypothetical protein